MAVATAQLISLFSSFVSFLRLLYIHIYPMLASTRAAALSFPTQSSVKAKFKTPRCCKPPRSSVVFRSAQDPDAIAARDIPIVNLEELDGSSADAFYSSLAERGPETLNVIVAYTAKCMPCKLAKPQMKDWEVELQSQGRNVRFWQFGLTLPCVLTSTSTTVRPRLSHYALSHYALSHYALRSIDRHKDVAKSLGVNSSPRFLCIKDGQLMAHMRGKAALEEFKTFVYNEC